MFLNVVQAEKRTSRLDRQIGVGLTYATTSPRIAPNQLGVVATATRVNSRFAASHQLMLSTKHAAHNENLTELYARWVLAKWLTVQPNVQYIVCPGGYSDRDDITILGLRVTASFD